MLFFCKEICISFIFMFGVVMVLIHLFSGNNDEIQTLYSDAHRCKASVLRLYVVCSLRMLFEYF